MISTSGSTFCTSCSVDQCSDFDELVTDGYIANLPEDPDGTSAWDSAAGGTGYTLTIATNGIARVTSCGAEEDTITVAR
jgi:hypothetical protein